MYLMFWCSRRMIDFVPPREPRQIAYILLLTTDISTSLSTNAESSLRNLEDASYFRRQNLSWNDRLCCDLRLKSDRLCRIVDVLTRCCDPQTASAFKTWLFVSASALSTKNTNFYIISSIVLNMTDLARNAKLRHPVRWPWLIFSAAETLSHAMAFAGRAL